MFGVKPSRNALTFLALFHWFLGSVCHAAPCDDYVALGAIASKHQLKVPINRPDRITLRNNGIELSFRAQSRTFYANGILMPLGFPVTAKAGKLCVTRSDYVAHLCPFFTEWRPSVPQKMVVVLDPGHGGRDGGASPSADLKEKTITLDICKKIAQLLSDRGHVVYLTRNSDTFVELDERTNFANQKSANLFVSVHCNGSESKLPCGIETFALTPHGQPSQHKTKFAPSEPKRYANNRFDGENLMLAYNIQRALLKKTGGTDRGVKHAHFCILKNLKCPGVLVECGFLSNATERKKLTLDEYRKALAQAVVEGIASFTK
jgi:N-acetylmuramoyl-L-alanine amidase